ncbi:MAG: hypothetical protein ACXVHJ_37100 [Solirubrobacteraceae bacterium]
MPDAALEELPQFIGPMLASAGPAPTEAGWALEVKWDGLRAQLRYDGRRVCGARARVATAPMSSPSWRRSPVRLPAGA